MSVQLTIMLSPEDEDLLSYILIWPRNHKDVNGKQAFELRWGRKRKLLHRIIMSRMLGKRAPRSMMVDHIDRNPLNNTRGNLRLATARQNAANRTRRQRAGGRYTGVYSTKSGKWEVRVSVPTSKGYKRVSLGTYVSEEDAARKYNEWMLETHGGYANLNVIKED